MYSVDKSVYKEEHAYRKTPHTHTHTTPISPSCTSDGADLCSVVHDGAQIVGHVVVADFIDEVEVGAIRFLDVVSVDVHMVVPVGAALLVVEAQRVPDLMDHDAKLRRMGSVLSSASPLTPTISKGRKGDQSGFSE